MINRQRGQGSQSTKRGADKSGKNTQNAPDFICTNCLPKPKNLGFWWKKDSLGVCSPWEQQWRAVCTQSLTQKGRKKIYLQQTTTTVSSVLGWAKGLLNFFIEIVLLELGLMKIVTVLKKTSSEVWKCDFSFNFAHW